jgi:hypothetical protein
LWEIALIPHAHKLSQVNSASALTWDSCVRLGPTGPDAAAPLLVTSVPLRAASILNRWRFLTNNPKPQKLFNHIAQKIKAIKNYNIYRLDGDAINGGSINGSGMDGLYLVAMNGRSIEGSYFYEPIQRRTV